MCVTETQSDFHRKHQAICEASATVFHYGRVGKLDKMTVGMELAATLLKFMRKPWVEQYCALTGRAARAIIFFVSRN